jgi:hypothetical protein
MRDSLVLMISEFEKGFMSPDDKPIAVYRESYLLSMLEDSYCTYTNHCHSNIILKDGSVLCDYNQIKLKRVEVLLVSKLNWLCRLKVGDVCKANKIKIPQKIKVYFFKQLRTIHKKIAENENTFIFIKDKYIMLETLDGSTQEILISKKIKDYPEHIVNIMITEAFTGVYNGDDSDLNERKETFLKRVFRLEEDFISIDIPRYKEVLEEKNHDR